MRRIRPLDPRSTSGTLTLPTEPRRGTSVRSRLVRVRRINAIPDSPRPLVQGHLLHRPLHGRSGRRIVPGRNTTLRRRRVGRKAVRVGRDVRFRRRQWASIGSGREGSFGLGSSLGHVRRDVVELEVVGDVVLGGDASAEPLSRSSTFSGQLSGRMVYCDNVQGAGKPHRPSTSAPDQARSIL